MEIVIDAFARTGCSRTSVSIDKERRVGFYEQYDHSLDELERSLSQANRYLKLGRCCGETASRNLLAYKTP